MTHAPLFLLALLAAAPVALAGPVTFTCDSTPSALDCSFAGHAWSAPAPARDAFYAFADHGFAEAVALGACPPEGTCIHQDAPGVVSIDATERAEPSGQRDYVGTITLLP